MVDVTIKTKTRTIKEKIEDWKELQSLLLKYENYVSVSARDSNAKEYNDEERHTR